MVFITLVTLYQSMSSLLLLLLLLLLPPPPPPPLDYYYYFLYELTLASWFIFFVSSDWCSFLRPADWSVVLAPLSFDRSTSSSSSYTTWGSHDHHMTSHGDKGRGELLRELLHCLLLHPAQKNSEEKIFLKILTCFPPTPE